MKKVFVFFAAAVLISVFALSPIFSIQTQEINLFGPETLSLTLVGRYDKREVTPSYFEGKMTYYESLDGMPDYEVFEFRKIDNPIDGQTDYSLEECINHWGSVLFNAVNYFMEDGYAVTVSLGKFDGAVYYLRTYMYESGGIIKGVNELIACDDARLGKSSLYIWLPVNYTFDCRRNGFAGYDYYSYEYSYNFVPDVYFLTIPKADYSIDEFINGYVDGTSDFQELKIFNDACCRTVYVTLSDGTEQYIAVFDQGESFDVVFFNETKPSYMIQCMIHGIG